jgi:hypothetical protein
MPGDDDIILVNEDRIGKAERLDAVGNLPELAFGMRASGGTRSPSPPMSGSGRAN